MNSAYKHLDSKLKIAGMTLSQWFGVLMGVGFGMGWGFFLSPFGTYVTLGTAVYLGTVPVGLALMSGMLELDAWFVVRSALGWLRRPGVFAPGSGPPSAGYLVQDLRPAGDDTTMPTLDPATLWD